MKKLDLSFRKKIALKSVISRNVAFACWAALFCISLGACKNSHDRNKDQHRTWKDYGGGPDQSKFVEVDEINKSNVNQLQVAWFYPTGDDNVYQFNPLIVDNVMYVLAKDNSLVALDATTGKEIWIHANLRGISSRGINYWESEDKKDKRLLFQMNNYLQAIDANTGKSILTFGKAGLVDLREGLDRDPKTLTRVQSGTPGKIFEDLILLGSSTGENYVSTPGHLRAFNVVTGKLVWTFHTIPHPGEFGYETWPKDAYKYIGGVNVWGEISVDAARGIAYYPLGSPTYDYYGGDRIGSNLYGNSILALDARTGKRIWHFQTVHHDIWDYDLSAAPQLITVNHNGKKIDAVAVAGKNGSMYAFDRVTGEPLWPIEERPVPRSELPGEQSWPTQPFQTVIPPFGRQNMTSKDLSNVLMTPEERATWLKRIDSMRTGFYTPVSMTHETLAIPGAVGGASWGSTAANPEKGLVYVRNIDWPSVYGRVEKRDPPTPGDGVSNNIMGGGQEIYIKNCQACHGVERRGGIGPALVDVRSRFDFKKFQQVVLAGKGEMPAFAHLDESSLKNIFSYLVSESGNVRENRLVNNKPGSTKAGPVTGPVVATGGAPGGQEMREVTGPASNPANMGMKAYGIPYPEGVNAPVSRYFIPPGWGLGSPYIVSPPWSYIVAYDLNKGTIKWKIPVGLDLKAAEQGAKNTGMLRAQRHGMIVTSSGLLFCTSRDGKIYAFDAETGKELWAGKLPTGTQGLPSMYEVDGRHYLVVSATTPVKFGRDNGEDSRGVDKSEALAKAPQGGYVVFALPK